MTSILLLAIGIAVVVALLGSVAFQSLSSTHDDVLSPLEKKCQEIANEGYRIHSLYPDSNPEDLLEDDMNRLLYLDNLWIKDCVSVLPADSVFSIVNNVERDFSYGE
jgi:hypothetical protein